MPRWLLLLCIGIAVHSLWVPVDAQQLSWTGISDNHWSTPTNWLPNSAPAGRDLVIGDIAFGETMVDADITASSLTVQGGSTADTAGHQLTVDGVALVTGIGSQLIVSPHATSASLPAAEARGVELFAGGQVTLASGVLQLDDPSSSVATMTINPGSTLAGTGFVHLAETLTGTPMVTFSNDGEIRAAGTVAFSAADNNHRLDLDGTSGNGSITVAENAHLQLDVPTETFGGDLTLRDGGTLEYSSPLHIGEVASINLHSSGTASGDPTIVSNELLTIEGAQIDASGHKSKVDAPFEFRQGSGGGTTVQQGALLEFTRDGTFTGGTTHNGAGTIKFSNASFEVTGRQVFSMSQGILKGTVVLDGNQQQPEHWQIDAPLILADGLLDDFGDNVNSEVDTININSLAGGQLLVDQADAAEWTLAAQGTIQIEGNLPTAERVGTSLQGDNLRVEGLIEINGSTAIDAKLNVQDTGIVEISEAGNFLTLGQGTNTTAHRLAGGSILGPGEVRSVADLIGHGTIAAAIDFSPSSSLLAVDGTLEISGQILNAGTLGTQDSSGTLQLTSGINTSNSVSLTLNGGSVTGSFIANNGVTNGRGSISVDNFINNGILHAVTGPGEELVVAATNGVDLDGALLPRGTVQATAGNLTIASPLTTAFAGQATVGTGYTLRLQQGWTLANSGTLNLTSDGSTPATLDSTDSRLEGTIGVAFAGKTTGTTTFAAEASIEFSPSGSVLELAGQTTIEQGVTISGGGTVRNLTGATLIAESFTLPAVDNQGELHLNGTLTLTRFDQAANGALYLDIANTSSFDQVDVRGFATLGGMLDVSLDPSYQPAVGDSFVLLKNTRTISGTFATDVPDLPTLGSGLGWDLVYTTNQVVLSVVATQLPGDFNRDHIVDMADYTVWRNNLGAATEDNIGGNGDGLNGIDAADYMLWKQHFGESLTPNLATHSVPEPNGLLLMLVAIGIASVRGYMLYSPLPQRQQ